MKEIRLKYNPYTFEKELSIEGQQASDEQLARICCSGNQEISCWALNFFKQLSILVNDNFVVLYSGIERDFDSLEFWRKEFEKKSEGISVELKFEHRYEVKDKIKELNDLFNKMLEESPYEELKTGKIIEELKNDFNKSVNSDCEMAVVALVSSGKSTLINALMGRKLLPAVNKATTQIITRIHDKKGQDSFKASAYNSKGELFKVCDPVTFADMKDLNNIDKNDTTKVEIEGDIKGINSENLHLILTDTPGTNNAGHNREIHHAYTMNLLKTDYKPMILYVVNPDNTSVTDNELLLNEISELMNSGDKQNQERFIFILNKADEFNIDEESVAEEIDEAKDFFRKHNINNPRIFPCSAAAAKFNRMKMSGIELTESEEIDFEACNNKLIPKQKHFWQYADFISPITKSKFNEIAHEVEENGNELEKKLQDSGITAIEYAISEYLQKYALPAKVSQGAQIFENKIKTLGIESKKLDEIKDNQKAIDETIELLNEVENKIKTSDYAENLKHNIESYSFESEIIQLLEKESGSFATKMEFALKPYRNRNIPSSDVQTQIAAINNIVEDSETNFRINIQSQAEAIFKQEVGKFTDYYKQYLQDLVGSIDVDIKPEFIFGALSNMSINSVLDSYKRQERVKVGEHYSKNPDYHWYDWIANWFRSVEKPKMILYDDYKNKTFVDFDAIINDRIQSLTVNFTDDTAQSLEEGTKIFEEQIKNVFLEKFEEYSKLINEKIAEKQRMLSDKNEIEKLMTENKRKLDWYVDFENELNSILSMED